MRRASESMLLDTLCWEWEMGLQNPGKCKVLVKVVGIFDNDTTKLVEVKA